MRNQFQLVQVGEAWVPTSEEWVQNSTELVQEMMRLVRNIVSGKKETRSCFAETICVLVCRNETPSRTRFVLLMQKNIISLAPGKRSSSFRRHLLRVQNKRGSSCCTKETCTKIFIWNVVFSGSSQVLSIRAPTLLSTRTLSFKICYMHHCFDTT